MLILPRFARSVLSRFAQPRPEVHPWSELAARRELRHASLAIVGNAGYLAECEHGSLIDSHDLVLRMNNFRTCGYEGRVGRKLDIFLTTFHGDVELSRSELKSARLVVASVPFNWRKPRGLNYRHAEQITRGLSRLGRPEVYVPSSDYFLGLRRSLGAYPTTGAMGLLLAIDFLLPVCGRIYVTGFSFFEGRSHYFGDSQIAPRNHRPNSERQLLLRRLAPHLQSGQIQIDSRMQAHLTGQSSTRLAG